MRPLLAAAIGVLAASAALHGDTGPECSVERYRARAVDLDDGRLLYVEYHAERSCDGRLLDSRVVYVDAAGDTMSTKSLDFRPGLITPSVVLEDGRTRYREGAVVQPDSLVLFRQVDGEEEERTSLELDGPAAVDAGFDHAVRRYWERLVTGERVTFDFAVPDKLRTFGFRIRRLEPPSDRLRLRIEPSLFLLRWIAPHIDLTYDVDSRHLLSYRGISNVRDRDGRRYRALIRFEERGAD
jgi:hypothetical protein